MGKVNEEVFWQPDWSDFIFVNVRLEALVKFWRDITPVKAVKVF
jgi:hypothetical protein